MWCEPLQLQRQPAQQDQPACLKSRGETCGVSLCSLNGSLPSRTSLPAAMLRLFMRLQLACSQMEGTCRPRDTHHHLVQGYTITGKGRMLTSPCKESLWAAFQ